MDDAMVRVKNLVKRYGSFFAVNDVSFDVRQGEVFGLLGPNGAGKTTTLECLEGLRRIDEGSITVAGYAPGSRELGKVLGVQLQSSSLPDTIRAAEAMELICGWHGATARLDLLDRFGLAQTHNTLYHDMSTGQKRRLHLALALANNPKAVVLDEPTAGLDVQGRAKLHDSIRALKAEGITVLLATHDMAEAELLCDRIAILMRGRVVALGTPEQVTAAGNADTRITLKTKRNLLLGRDVGSARFQSSTEGYGVWRCKDAAAAVMDLLKEVQTGGDAVDDLRVERPSLEERFLEIVEGGKLA